MSKYAEARRKLQQKQRRVRGAVVLSSLVAAIGLFVFWNSQQAMGAGGTGSGGSAGACVNYCTDNGHGWRLYPTSSGGPSGGFANGTAWPAVQARCAGIPQVAVYVIYNGSGGLKSWDYKDRYALLPGLIESGNSFISLAAARAGFDRLDPSIKAGYTYGSNVSWYCYGSAAVVKKWTISGGTSMTVNGASASGTQASPTRVYPGQTVTWTHYLNNAGPDKNDKNISYTVKTWNGDVTGTIGGKSPGRIYDYGPAQGSANNTYSVGADRVGQTICGRIEWTPKSYNNNGMGSSSYNCVLVASNYSLFPSITLGGSTTGVIMVGGTIDQQSTVQNTGSNADVTSNFQTYEFVIPSGKTADFSTVFKDQSGHVYATAPGGGANICVWLSSQYPGAINCKSQVTNGSQQFPAATTSVDSSPISAAAYQPGDMICRLLWVDHYDYLHAGSDERRVAFPACARVAKTPYVQFWGSDVRAGNNVAGATSTQADVLTSSNLIGGKTYGSWAEYGIFAPTSGTIRSVSASGLSGSSGFTGALTDSDTARLTFANTTTPRGNWAPPQNIASFENRFGLADGGANSAASINLGALGSRGKVRLTNPSGTVRVSGTLADGIVMLWYPTGTVVIDNNILLGTSSFSNASGVSQLIIQAKNIIINSNVDRVDAWLSAAPVGGSDGGVVSTCDAIATPYYSGLGTATNSACNQKQLRVNGPVLAREIQLRRTFGGEGDGTPAEIFNLRADAYIWTTRPVGASTSGMYTTMFTTELPPRF